MTRRKSKTPNNEQANPPLAASRLVEALAEDRLRPWLLSAMTALLVARPLFPSESAGSQGDGLSMVMLWIALGVIWLFGIVATSMGSPKETSPFSAAQKPGQPSVGRPTFSLRFGWTDAAVLLLVLWTTVAALWAVHRGTPRPAVNMLWEWVGLGLCFFLARQFIVTPRERRAVVAVMIALAVAVSGFGLYHCVYEMPETRARYRADPDGEMRRADLWFPPGSPERKLFEDRLENTQPVATFALTNSLAAFLTPWLVMLAGVMAATVGGDSRRRNTTDDTPIGDGCRLLQHKRLLGMLVCLVPIAVCLLLTKSRSGYAAVCVGALLVWLLGRERRVRIGWKLPATLAAVLAAILCVAMAIEGAAVLGRASKSFGYRLQYWQSSLQMIADHPWVGCGPGNFQPAYMQYKLPEASEEIADPHNFFLEIWATAGTPAALAFLAVLGFSVLGVRGQGPGARSEGSETGDLRSPSLEISKSPNSNPQSLIPNPSSDGWKHVLAGGIVGFLLAVPMGMLSAAPLGAVPVLLGLPLAAAAVALMHGWIRDGVLPRWLPGVCVIALLINLLAAGGIGFPGIAGTFWLLLALTLDGRHRRTWPMVAAWAALVVCLALSVACYFTAYRPVMKCQMELQFAEQEPDRAIAHIEAAAAADPLSSEPWRQMAAIAIEAWCKRPQNVIFSRFLEAKDKALELSPNSAGLWLAAGDWMSRAYSKTDDHGNRLMPGAIQSAVESYRRAVQLYPNSALRRAKLAEASLAAGDRAAFRREAEIALRLDQITPHSDKKLPAPLRDRLGSLLEDKQPSSGPQP
jgi:O-antigen ligase